MKRIIYIANIRLPTEKAHGLQIMKTCEAFAGFGYEVKLIAPNRRTPIKENPFAYYGVKENFMITRLPTLDMLFLGRVGFWIQNFSFAISVAIFTLFKQADVIYGRDEVSLYFLSFIRKNIFYEIHTGRLSFFVKHLVRKCSGVVAITRGLKDFLVDNGVEEKKITIARDAVDIEKFSLEITKDEARKKLQLPLDKKLVIYTGHLYEWKGVDTLAKASELLEKDILVVFVGGTDTDLNLFRKKYGHIPNISLFGQKPYSDMPLYTRAADVLVIPNTAKDETSRVYTSPMKLFEYMTSGTPIVASDLPSVREVLNERNSVLVLPDSPDDFARGINFALVETKKTSQMTEKALEDVKQYSWTKRAERIKEFSFKQSTISKNVMPDNIFYILRFFVSGGTATIMTLGSLYYFREVAEFSNFGAINSAYGIGVVVNFTLQKLFTFRNKSVALATKQFSLFLFGAVAYAIMNNLFMHIFLSIGIWYLLAQAITLGLLAFISFIYYGKIVFTKSV